MYFQRNTHHHFINPTSKKNTLDERGKAGLTRLFQHSFDFRLTWSVLIDGFETEKHPYIGALDDAKDAHLQYVAVPDIKI